MRWVIINAVGFPRSSAGKESACNVGDLGSIPEVRRCPGGGHGRPLQYSWACLVAKLVKNLPAMWETWVQSLGWEDPLKRKRLPTPVFKLGELHELYSPWAHKELDRISNLLGFQIIKVDAVKVLHSICQQIWKNSSAVTGLEKVSFHSNPKERQCQRMLKLNSSHTLAM